MTETPFLSESEVKSLLPLRSETAHKGDCGRVFVVAGSSSMMGAAVLTAKAALRAGAGLVYLLTVEEAVQSVNVEVPEIIVLPLNSESGYLTLESFSQVQDYMVQFRPSVCAIGPGLGRAAETQDFVRAVLVHFAEKSVPMVIDADALVAIKPESLKAMPMNQNVLTPHPKEFERLFGPVVGVDNRVDLATEYAQDSQQVLVLKGHHSVIAYAGTAVLNPTGNPGMATAGSGDVLTGVISAFIGQGLMPGDAACLGVYVHGLSGDKASQALGVHSMMASDIIEYLSGALLELNR